MISVERALNSIREKSTEEVREFARNRILGTDIVSFGSGHSTEPSEDVVIQLLRNPELESEKREAVVKGWMDVYQEMRKWLDSFDWTAGIDKWKNAFVNLCRVVDIAEPPEFKKYVKRLITELLDEESCPGELLGAAVKAYMAYAQDEKSIRFWEDEILKNKDVAAYGFNALLDIDPKHPRIEKHLCKLWRLQVEENWLINTAFLLRRAARVRNETALINRVLLKLKNKDYSLWKKIEKELKEPWSQQWLEKLAGFEPPRHREVYKRNQEREYISGRKANSRLEVKFEDLGIALDGYIHGRLNFRMPMVDMDYMDIIRKHLGRQEAKSRIKIVDFKEVFEEIEYV